jgi:8-oxo-dGTP pyrophosphatase MutT (NUDIX family)
MHMPIWVRQAAAIPVRDDRVCLVTSSSGRRWVVPKGQIDPGHTAGEAALVEAWEEAGLVGALDAEPLGTYAYEKLGRSLLVLVFRMVVTEVRDEWPERQLRTRVWVTLDEALERIDEPGLRDLLRLAFHLKHPDRLALATA